MLRSGHVQSCHQGHKVSCDTWGGAARAEEELSRNVESDWRMTPKRP